MRFIEELDIPPMDFIPRDRQRQIFQLMALFGICILLMLAFSFIPSTIAGKNLGAFVSITIVMIFFFYIVYRKQLSLDLVMATEYHNMILTQAATLGSAFCIFVERNGAVLYANDGVYNVFSEFNYSRSRMLEGILEKAGVAKTDRDRIRAAIETNKSDRLIFPIGTTPDTAKTYILTVDPLPRPANVLLIRGREYQGERTGSQLFPDALRGTSSEKIDHLLGTAPFGLYTTDAQGRFEYVNPCFERALGYEIGEMIHQSITLHQVLYALNQDSLRVDYTPMAFHGHATFTQKNGVRIAAHMQQSLLKNSDGYSEGVTGTVLFESPENPAS